MQMNVSLTEELHEIVQSKVASGLYSNASEVIRDAIRKLEKEEQRDNAWQKLNTILEDSERSGRSSNSMDDLVNNVLKNG